MAANARGRRVMSEAEQQAEEEVRRRAHHLAVARATSSAQPQQQQHLVLPVQPSSSLAVPLAVDRKEAYLLGGNALVAPDGQVGKGGFAIVRLADDGRTVVKTYPGASEDPITQRHLQNELALAGRIRHPNIIGPGRVARPSSDRVEIEMEYAPGGSLGDYVKRAKYASSTGSALPESEACALFQGVVDAVAYLHANELQHGDIKMGNVLLDGRHVARLIDFGTCRAASPTAGSPPLPGTLSCMAPETLDGRTQYEGRPADVWSLGVLLINLLMRGEYPFLGRDEADIRRNICTGGPRMPEGVSAPCRDLLERMFSKEPSTRLRIEEVARHPWVTSIRGVQSKDPMVAADLSAHMRFLLKAS
jgi:serine/threonine protein kinase